MTIIYEKITPRATTVRKPICREARNKEHDGVLVMPVLSHYNGADLY